MSKQFRLNEIEIDGYYFLNYEGLYWHSGKFWYREIECKQVYNNGSIAIKVNNTKLGLTKLRAQARKCKIKLNLLPIPF